MRCYGKKLHHMYHASLSNLMEFSFSQKFSRNFREIFAKIFAETKIFAKRNFAKIVPSHDFRILSKIEKCIFVSTLILRSWLYSLTRLLKIAHGCIRKYLPVLIYLLTLFNAKTTTGLWFNDGLFAHEPWLCRKPWYGEGATGLLSCSRNLLQLITNVSNFRHSYL
jgi:hypothetical protein